MMTSWQNTVYFPPISKIQSLVGQWCAIFSLINTGSCGSTV